MALHSKLLSGDAKLEAAAVSDPAHIVPGTRGAHVGKIQSALIQLDGAKIAQDSIYGPATAAAVRAYKQKRKILNFRGAIDDIVGKKTIASLDLEMAAQEGGGTIRVGLNFSLRLGDLRFDDEVITVPVRHVLVYFSGIADDAGFGGVLLQGAHGKVVLTDMENMSAPAGHIKAVIGFGGSLRNSAGVEQALAFVRSLRDSRGKLVIYGFSAGGVNSLELSRRLANLDPPILVDRLVTVDVASGADSLSLDRSVPTNVNNCINFFQTKPSLKGSRGDVATGPGPHIDKDITSEFTTFFTSTNHGNMEDKTRNRAVEEMKTEVNSK